MSNITTFIHFERDNTVSIEDGRNSDVFVAKDKQLDAPLVIKKISKANFHPEEYFKEAQIMYQFSHKNIAEIQYASQDDESIYFAMPFYKKGSLSDLMKKRYLTTREIVKYSLDLLTAVNFMHSKNLLHLDIKPNNILLSDSNNGIVTDFGLAKYTNSEGLAVQDMVYMKIVDPEYYSDGKRSVQSDIYQIGLTMYMMCNGIDSVYGYMIPIQKEAIDFALGKGFKKGTLPFRREVGKKIYELYREKILSDELPNKNTFLAHIPDRLKQVIVKALKLDPTERYSNTIEMMNDISKIEDNLDWQYFTKPDEKYLKFTDKYEYNIIIDNDKKSIETTKTTLESGRCIRKRTCCFSFNDKRDKRVKLRTIFREI